VDNALPPPNATQTTRERLVEHRKRADCASCHALMDVLGYGFENYDGIGRFRTKENGVPVDNQGEITDSDVDGTFHGAIELGQRLVASKQVHRCLATNWFRYALGRMETPLDACSIDAVTAKFEASDLRVPDLLVALVESDAFRVRRAVEAGQ
jgi:hypothetical protein